MELVAALVAVVTLYDIKPMDQPLNAPEVNESASPETFLENVNLRYIPRF
jgi:hypothetical protein